MLQKDTRANSTNHPTINSAGVSIDQGWLSCARRVISPNCNVRPESAEISLLVIHNISLPPEQFGGGHIEAFFQNTLESSLHPYFDTIKDLQVSSHIVITREGEVIQFVPFDQRAWHAGVSNFKGVENCNDFSIGIELEGTDIHPYTEQQYQQLVQVTQVLVREYPKIDVSRIVGHCDIAPGRKTDPGQSFDWMRYQDALK